MKRYDKYKNSGIDWIGEIPEHWKIEKLGWQGIFTASGIDKKTIKGEPLVNMINYTDIYGNKDLTLTADRKYMIVSCPETKKEFHQVNVGDLIFTPSSETIDDIGLSALVIEELPNTVYSYHVIRLHFTKDFDIKFRKYLCNNNFVLNQFSRQAKGTTRQIIGRDVFKNIQVVIPTKQEQTAIANYLDRKTNEIDELIAKKERLLELYEEEKTAIINQAVTKGINPDVKMKDSGIDWLGKIPEHWEVKKLKYVVDINKETLSEKTNDDYQIEYIDIGNVEYGRLKERPKKLLFGKAPSRARRIVNSGDTLISTVRTYLKAILFIENSKDNLIASTGFAVITPRDIFLPGYLFYILSSEIVLQNITANSVGVSYPAINASEIADFYSWFPEKKEQKMIIDFIETEINRINTKVEMTKKLIDLLNEYKQALISEIVTGKIKVV